MQRRVSALLVGVASARKKTGAGLMVQHWAIYVCGGGMKALSIGNIGSNETTCLVSDV